MSFLGEPFKRSKSHLDFRVSFAWGMLGVWHKQLIKINNREQCADIILGVCFTELAWIVAVTWIMSDTMELDLNVSSSRAGEFCRGKRDLWCVHSIIRIESNKRAFNGEELDWGIIISALRNYFWNCRQTNTAKIKTQRVSVLSIINHACQSISS